MGVEKKHCTSTLLIGIILLHLSSQVFAFKCPLPLGFELSCPSMFNDEDKIFCCNSQENVPYCCNLGDYIANHSAIIAGILVAILIVLVIVTICCCCFCSCCCLAKRRVSRGQVLYGQVPTAPIPRSTASTTYASSSYPASYPLQSETMLHSPPNSFAQPPPPYPTSGYQPPINPEYLTKN